MKDDLYRIVADYLLDEEIKEKRAKLRDRVIFWGGAICFLILVVIATKSYGAVTMIIKAPDGDYVRLLDKPCESKEVLALVNPAVAPRLKRADMRYQGKDYKACWTQFNDGMQELAVIIDEAADVTPIPMKMFAPEAV